LVSTRFAQFARLGFRVVIAREKPNLVKNLGFPVDPKSNKVFGPSGRIVIGLEPFNAIPIGCFARNGQGSGIDAYRMAISLSNDYRGTAQFRTFRDVLRFVNPHIWENARSDGFHPTVP
jgi:hypothetical protein